jgi:hypothetical protein
LLDSVTSSAYAPGKTLLQILAAERMVGLAGAMRSRLMAERNVVKTADGTLGQPAETPQDEALRTMNVSVGDTIVMQIPDDDSASVSPPPPQPPTQSSPTPPSPADPATRPVSTSGAAPNTSRMWPYVLTALLGTGLGAGAVGVPALLRDKPPAAVDTDTQYEFEDMKISSNGDAK